MKNRPPENIFAKLDEPAAPGKLDTNALPAWRPLKGKHAVVTGGGRGIGLAVGMALARLGANITLMGRNRDVLRQGLDRVSAAGTDISFLATECDVTDAEAVSRAFAASRESLGDADILVNNAGQSKSEKFLDTDRALWDRMISANLTSVYLCTREVLPAMLAAKNGRIVNIASTLGVKGAARMTAYTAAKHGVVGLTRALALETVKAGITVNAVCPGFTDTEMTEQGVRELMEAKKIGRHEALAMITRVIPRGKLTTPAEVASAVAWLCEPAASAVTGQAIEVSGGE
jgi:NAD(P)-dependent dehydrogenase (short-subunit alcohol dehydrogenase family)